MASVLAIISKKVFERQARLDDGRPADIGDVLPIDRYDSSNRHLETLTAGGTLFLVTVRPDERLWLVAVLLGPQRAEDAWVGAKNPAPITDITSLVPRFRFASGKGLVAKKGALGMSLQTPRQLTEPDLDLLRVALGVEPPARPGPADATKPPTRKARQPSK